MKQHLRSLCLLSFALTCSLFSCDKSDPAATVQLKVALQATYDGKPLSDANSYALGTSQLRFSRFNTYLSDITLANSDVEVIMSEIEWAQFLPKTSNLDSAGRVVFTFEVPEGKYTSLKMGLGVKPSLNGKRPSDFAVNHPLYQENEYWTGWKSYIFTKVEGKSTVNGVAGNALTHHCGSDEVYTKVEYAQDIEVDGKKGILITMDLKKLMTYDGTPLDLSQINNLATSHDASNLTLGKKIMANFKNAITVGTN